MLAGLRAAPLAEFETLIPPLPSLDRPAPGGAQRRAGPIGGRVRRTRARRPRPAALLRAAGRPRPGEPPNVLPTQAAAGAIEHAWRRDGQARDRLGTGDERRGGGAAAARRSAVRALESGPAARDRPASVGPASSEGDQMSADLLPEGSMLLHIGPYKTGTTAIQQSLYKHRSDLADPRRALPGLGSPTTSSELGGRRAAPRAAPRRSGRPRGRRCSTRWRPRRRPGSS